MDGYSEKDESKLTNTGNTNVNNVYERFKRQSSLPLEVSQQGKRDINVNNISHKLLSNLSPNPGEDNTI